MKDLKLPKVSDEERQKIWDNLKPNDKLVCIEHNNWSDDYHIKYFTVVKRTPKGSVRLHNGELLKYFYSSYYIVTNEVEEWIRKIQLEKEVMSLLSEADRNRRDFKENLNCDDAVKLKEILERIVEK